MDSLKSYRSENLIDYARAVHAYEAASPEFKVENLFKYLGLRSSRSDFPPMIDRTGTLSSII